MGKIITSKDKARSADFIRPPVRYHPHMVPGNAFRPPRPNPPRPQPVGRGIASTASVPCLPLASAPRGPLQTGHIGNRLHPSASSDQSRASYPQPFNSTGYSANRNPVAVRSQDVLFESTHTASLAQELSYGGENADSSPEGPILEGCSTDLSTWGLPQQIVCAYGRAGITSMFPWQASCLSIGAGRALNGGNLVFSAPTSAGKTLVAEILLLKRVVETKRKGLLVLPFVALAQEKLTGLQRLLKGSGLRVGGYIGNSNPRGGLALLDVAVCTIERANSLVNRLMKEGKLQELGVVVVDELHLVGDHSRGYLLELLLTKVMYVNRTRSCEDESQPETGWIQIVGMSATLPNLPLVKKWLDADLYITDFRPVSLTETIKLGSFLYNREWTKLRDLSAISDILDPEQMCGLCLETVQGGHSVLVFCPTKNWCETASLNISAQFVKTLPPNTVRTEHLNELLDQLKRTPAGLDAILRKTIPQAVAFHHAGLTADEREVVEGGFRKGLIKVLVATTTLSAGVNLPARRVIIRSPMVYEGTMKGMDPLTYRQMAGRAGRKGVDTQGESILICKNTPEEVRAVNTIFSAAARPLKSCLSIGSCDAPSASVQRAVLEIIVNKAALCVDHIFTYLQGALFACELNSEEECKRYAAGVIAALEQSHFIQTDEDGGSGVRATQLGNAVICSGLSPEDGKTVFEELSAARPNVNLQNELHILYLVTPLNVVRSIGDINFYQFMNIWDKMSPEWQKVGNLVGVDEAALLKGVRNDLKEPLRLSRIKRFWCALMLNELVLETGLGKVARKYDVNKGVLQSLQHGAASYSGMITVFCEELHWDSMALLFEQFQSRLEFGVKRELVQLVRVVQLSALQARCLHDAGFASLTKLATAEPPEVADVLRKATPFELMDMADGMKSNVVLNGMLALPSVEAAQLVITEARRLVEADMEVEGFLVIPNKLMA
ncbi:DNA polymerase theta-like [Paramacrobiotus metropolitanus]|uniref:DNA polymerase theta-like n=1 Tax=Paramacrobiotus metropolitanus TaxID=2943436 RepID=UPI0024456576|nr:DNA polymerase theta-like [Paramacrobiotus metropolitanus]